MSEDEKKEEDILSSWQFTFGIVIVWIIMLVIDLNDLAHGYNPSPTWGIAEVLLDVFVIVSFSITTLIRFSPKE